MKGGIDERKTMDPLFPRLHINDADKGGPRPPPRNKMALCEQYNVPSQCPRFNPESMPMLPLPSSNGPSSFVPLPSSSHVGIPKQGKVLPASCSLKGSSHLAERSQSYYSGGLNFNTSLANPELRLSRPLNHQDPRASRNLTTSNECSSLLPHGLSTYKNCYITGSGVRNDSRVPSFVQTGMVLKQGNPQTPLDKEKISNFSSVSSLKLHNTCLKEPKEVADGDRSRENQSIHVEKNSRLSHKTEDHPEMPVRVTEPFRSIDHQKSSLLHEKTRLRDIHHAESLQDCKNLQESKATTDGISGTPERMARKRSSSAIDDSSRSLPIPEGNNGQNKTETIKECSDDKDSGVGNTDKREETSDNSVADSGPRLGLTPDDVVGVIGQRLFWKARKTILHQQRLFAAQIFELHRLIKVQRLIAESPEVLYRNNFNLNKPPIKFPPINKLLYVTPLDSSPVVTKPKLGTLKSNPGTDHAAESVFRQLPPPINNLDKELPPQLSSPKPLSASPSVPNDAKLAVAPWYFHPPPANQWLVPVRSPSEGLVYKPYTGPCPPPVGVMAPVYGNCGPLGLSTVGATAFGVPAPNISGVGRFSSPSIGQSYFPPYAMPLLSSSSPNLEVEQVIPFAGANKNSTTFNSNFALPCQTLCNVSVQKAGGVSESGGNLNESRGSDMQGSSESSPAERLPGDALSLFPTTPSLQVSKDQDNEQKVQVIKVVPHNPRLAPESAARIFQTIQEERKKIYE